MLLLENITLPFFHSGSDSKSVRTRKDQYVSPQCQNWLKNERVIESLSSFSLWYKQICDHLGTELVPLDIAEPEWDLKE